MQLGEEMLFIKLEKNCKKGLCTRSESGKINIYGFEKGEFDILLDIQVERSRSTVGYRSGFQGTCVGSESNLEINIIYEL